MRTHEAAVVARLTLVTSAALTLTVTGCGGSSGSINKVKGTDLTVYSSLPLQGSNRPHSIATNRGAQLALDAIGGRIGRYTITFKQLDDATAQKGSWDPGQTTQDARTAIDDRSTIGYIGEFDWGASAISIPVLNRAGIPQISPANTPVGLTAGGSGANPGEPQKYYPTGRRTFARVIPNDTVQAAVQATLQKSEGCTRTYVFDDQQVYGQALANTFKAVAASQGITVSGVQGYDQTTSNYRSVAQSAAATGATCVFLSAMVDSSRVQLAEDVAAAMPRAKIFSADGLEVSPFFDPKKGGIPVSLDPRVFITAATRAPSDYPWAGQAFFKQYLAKYGKPEGYALYGYESMALLLDAIKRATNDGTTIASRSKVVGAIFSTKDRRSVLGTYSIDPNGDTTLRRYGVYRGVAGRLEFWKAVDA
jgi:branched-chain amino acid transport system substrate-binding protein